jgi:MFS transporter, PAT family, beta-lactamase induction signal transducer AmpG
MNEIEAVGAQAASGALDTSPQTGRSRPWLYALLIAPSAVLMNGVIQGGVIGYLGRQQGISGTRVADIVALLALPTSIYFLWSPITDFLVRRRTWLLIGGILGGVLMAAAFASGRLDGRRSMALMFLSACMSQLVVASCGGMMGAIGTERAKRVAGSFYQGGGTAFGAISISVLISIAGKVKPATLGLIAGSLIALPALFALAAPQQEVISEADFGRTMRRVWQEFKTTFLHWKAIPYTLLLGLPIGSGAAVGLLTGVAQDYGVSGQSVAWMNGVGGALLLAGGALSASLIPARLRASVAYCVMGLANAASIGVLGFGPMRPGTYFLGIGLYLFTVGANYALFTAVVLEFMGASGKTGSGRYSIINSLGNVPVLYTIKLDGWGGGRWGPRGISATEAVAGAVAAVVMLGYFLTHGRGVGASEAAAARNSRPV